MSWAEDEAVLVALRAVFQAHGGQLAVAEFVAAMLTVLPLPVPPEALEERFNKIDVDATRTITWDDFASYTLLELQQHHESDARAKQVKVETPATACPTAHKSSVVRVREHLRQAISLSDDGQLNFWSRQPQVGPPQRAVRMQLAPKAQQGAGRSCWATDFVLVPTMHKTVVASGEREIWFYDQNTLQAQFVICRLPDTPTKLAAYQDAGSHDTVVLFGDNKGVLTAITFPPHFHSCEAFSPTNRGPKGDAARIQFADLEAGGRRFGGVHVVRWKVHGEVVTEAYYSPQLRLLFTCSNHAETALVAGDIFRPVQDPPRSLPQRQQAPLVHGLRTNPNQLVFKHPSAIKCFCFSERHTLAITGGLDCKVRLFNPYVNLQPAGVLQGHTAPVSHIVCDDRRDRLVSIATDGDLKIWHTKDQLCLRTVSQRVHHMSADIHQMAFLGSFNRLAAFGTSLFVLPFKPGSHEQSKGATHPSPIKAVLHNPKFDQVFTGCAFGIVRVWDATTGKQAMGFSVRVDEAGEPLTSGADSEAALTAMCFDHTCNRLITASPGGCSHIWNCSNGQHIMSLKGSRAEVTSIRHVSQSSSSLRLIVQAGADRRIRVFRDFTDGLLSCLYPEPMQFDETVKHEEDILTLAQTDSVIVTADLSGKMVGWNLTSGTAVFVLQQPEQPLLHPRDTTTVSSALIDLMRDRAVYALALLPARRKRRGAASLVSGGGSGHVCFWNTDGRGYLLTHYFRGKGSIQSLACSDDERFLVAGSSEGNVFVWDIDGFCVGKEAVGFGRAPSTATKVPEPGTAEPRLATQWKGHHGAVTSLAIFHRLGTCYVLSGGADQYADLRTVEGHQVGQLGTHGWRVGGEDVDTSKTAAPKTTAAATQSSESSGQPPANEHEAVDVLVVEGPTETTATPRRRLPRPRSAPVLRRRSQQAQPGNWERHRQSNPSLTVGKAKVFRTLPYTSLTEVRLPAKPRFEPQEFYM